MSKLTELFGGGENLALFAALAAPFALPALGGALGLGAGSAAAGSGAIAGGNVAGAGMGNSVLAALEGAKGGSALGGLLTGAAGNVAKGVGTNIGLQTLMGALTPETQTPIQTPQVQLPQSPLLTNSGRIMDDPATQLRNLRQRALTRY